MEACTRGGASKKTVAATACALLRTVTSLRTGTVCGSSCVGSDGCEGDGDDIDTEVQERLRFIEPVLREKVPAGRAMRSPHLSGTARANRNVAEHADLGAGAEVVRSNALAPKRRQRGRRQLVSPSTGACATGVRQSTLDSWLGTGQRLDDVNISGTDVVDPTIKGAPATVQVQSVAPTAASVLPVNVEFAFVMPVATPVLGTNFALEPSAATSALPTTSFGTLATSLSPSASALLAASSVSRHEHYHIGTPRGDHNSAIAADSFLIVPQASDSFCRLTAQLAIDEGRGPDPRWGKPVLDWYITTIAGFALLVDEQRPVNKG